MTNNDDKQTNAEDVIFLCYWCGGPEPCRKWACIQAAMAGADYWDEESKKGPVN